MVHCKHGFTLKWCNIYNMEHVFFLPGGNDISMCIMFSGSFPVLRKGRQRHGKTAKMNGWCKDKCCEESLRMPDH